MALNSKPNQMREYIVGSLTQNKEITVHDLARHFFPRLSLGEAALQVHGYLAGLRNRKKNRLLVYPSEHGGKLIIMNGEKSLPVDIDRIFKSHLRRIYNLWKNCQRNVNDPVISTKFGFRIGDKMVELGLQIMQDVRQIQNTQYELHYGVNPNIQLERGSKATETGIPEGEIRGNGGNNKTARDN